MYLMWNKHFFFSETAWQDYEQESSLLIKNINMYINLPINKSCEVEKCIIRIIYSTYEICL